MEKIFRMADCTEEEKVVFATNSETQWKTGGKPLNVEW